jgi:DnaJ homolog subfamily C member 19
MKFILFVALLLVLYFLAKRAFATAGAMSTNEAAKLLDVAPDADHEAIVAAHKRLIAKVHPDAGGTAELAARINQARDVLLRRVST